MNVIEKLVCQNAKAHLGNNSFGKKCHVYDSIRKIRGTKKTGKKICGIVGVP